MKKILIMTAAILVLFSGTLIAGDMVTDRPDQTESPVTMPKGSLQIETGFEFSNESRIPSITVFPRSDGEINTRVFPTTLFRYGLTDKVELRIVSGYEKKMTDLDTVSGMNDMEVGLKIKLLEADFLGTEAALLAHSILPTGSKYMTDDMVGGNFILAVGHEINDKVGFGYNIGWSQYDDIDEGELYLSLAFGIGVTEKVGVFAETYGTINRFEKLSNFDAGVTYLITPDIQFDTSFGTGINHDMNFIACGVTVKFDKD